MERGRKHVHKLHNPSRKHHQMLLYYQYAKTSDSSPRADALQSANRLDRLAAVPRLSA